VERFLEDVCSTRVFYAIIKRTAMPARAAGEDG
jgi:hypothetical protein